MLAALAASIATASCPTSIPTFEVNIAQEFNGNSEDYKWIFGLTTPTDAAPDGYFQCGEMAYISQYDIANRFCASTLYAKVGESSAANMCTYSYSGNSRKATVALTCDASASVPRMEGKVGVTQDGPDYVYAFKGAFSGVCGGGGDDGDGGGDKKSGGCGGGCVFVILFFVGAFLYVAGTVAFNYFKLGKRGKELAPHPEFWLLIPGLIKDGAVFSFQMVTKPCRKDSGGSSYTQV